MECDGFQAYPGLKNVAVDAKVYDCASGDLKWLHKALGQHRTIWQEHSAKDFASYESYKRAGILYVFPPFTASASTADAHPTSSSPGWPALLPFRLLLTKADMHIAQSPSQPGG